MTIEKAIKELEIAKYFRQDINNSQICYDIAIEALEKQIPKDPMKEDELGKTRCPNCGRPLDDMGESIGNYYACGVTTFCHFCGQAIKWDEEEWMKGYDWKKDNPFFDWGDDNDD